MKAVYQTQDEIPEALRGEYEEKGGSFVLKVDGDLPSYAETVAALKSEKAAEQQKTAVFRDNNIAILKELDVKSMDEARDKLRTLKTVDPAEYQRLKARTAELESAGVRTPEDVTRQLIEKTKDHVAAAVKPLQDKLDEITRREKQAQAALARTTLENALRDAAAKAGVEERALPDFLNRGLNVFALKDGQVVALKNGEPQFSRRRAGETLSAEEWAQDLATDAPHLFRPSKGGGAGGGSGAPRKRFVGNDPLEFGANLDAIAKGEVSVSS
jgi:hypothetical protein